MKLKWDYVIYLIRLGLHIPVTTHTYLLHHSLSLRRISSYPTYNIQHTTFLTQKTIYKTQSRSNSTTTTYSTTKQRMRPSPIALIGTAFRLLESSNAYTAAAATIGNSFHSSSDHLSTRSIRRSSSILSSARQSSSETEVNTIPDATAAFANGIPPMDDIVGVIFDMDGTLIKPCIDFADMRSRVYAIADADSNLKHKPEEERRGDILELYQFLSDEGKALAKAVFDDIEAKAMRDMELMDSVGDICHFLDDKGIKRAILTKNVEKSVIGMQEMMRNEHSIKEFFPCVNRETKGGDGDESSDTLPSKPSPEAILHICKVWGCSPADVIMVGDSAADDIAAAHRAGCGGRVLLQLNGESVDNDAGGGDAVTDAERAERVPSLTVSNLSELLSIMQSSSK